MTQWWPIEVQEREQHLYYEVNEDTYIFRSRDAGTYFVVGNVDPLGIKVISQYADLVRYCSQRVKFVDPDLIGWWLRA